MTERNANHDYLKIVAMYGIVLFHHFGQKIPNHFVQLKEGFTLDSYFYDFINNTSQGVSKVSLIMDFCYGHFGNGNNFIFMLITGYYMFGRDISNYQMTKKVAKILYAILYFGIVLSITNYVILKMFYPFSNCEDFTFTFFYLPKWLCDDNLWYIRAYGFFILIVIPILKLFENKITRSIHIYIIFALIVINLLSYNEWIPNIFFSSEIMFFVMCYYLGGYISRYLTEVRKGVWVIISITYLVVYFVYEYFWRCTCSTFYEPFEYSFIAVIVENKSFICCMVYSVLLFLFFNSFKINLSIFNKLANRIASSTIGIYIFHSNMLALSFILADMFWWCDWTRKGYFLFCLIDSVLLFVVGGVLDCGRQYTYKIIKNSISRFSKKIWHV